MIPFVLCRVGRSIIIFGARSVACFEERNKERKKGNCKIKNEEREGAGLNKIPGCQVRFR
ncbi:hypothetical protein B0T26DRAFT_698472 [Lasiosphaeria miniovina]|uniref:Uncharacterized protein n=1 Tax=Lasiosphaeria miniovina TaxID=1954250 RepID=A0AA40B6M5_9PEZI|nr:uncharacterized protein B0T26DRAFT_698472 [Lasiosphaeria miniovina]KAK0728567.1 hypothetical protein B0T26DRAFT_698472 [Lasiosphaeria miniovina]